MLQRETDKSPWESDGKTYVTLCDCFSKINSGVERFPSKILPSYFWRLCDKITYIGLPQQQKVLHKWYLHHGWTHEWICVWGPKSRLLPGRCECFWVFLRFFHIYHLSNKDKNNIEAFVCFERICGPGVWCCPDWLCRVEMWHIAKLNKTQQWHQWQNGTISVTLIKVFSTLFYSLIFSVLKCCLLKICVWRPEWLLFPGQRECLYTQIFAHLSSQQQRQK